MIHLPLADDRGVGRCLTRGRAALRQDTQRGRTIMGTAGGETLLCLYFPGAEERVSDELHDRGRADRFA
jgi:hypothetical protein